MSVDEIRRMPHNTGLLAYRNRRGVLLELTGWDERRDAADIRTTKAATEAEQAEVFRAPAPAPAPPASPEPAVEEVPE
jgi:hypothetical protein